MLKKIILVVSMIFLATPVKAQDELNTILGAKSWWLKKENIGQVSGATTENFRYYYQLASYALYDYLKNHPEWKVIHRASYDYKGERIPTIEEKFLIDNQGNQVQALSHGYYFIENGDKRLILATLETYYYSNDFSILGADEDMDLVLKMRDEIALYESVKNMYAKSVIEIVKKPNRENFGFYFKFLTNVADFNSDWEDLILEPKLFELSKRYTNTFVNQLTNPETSGFKKGVLLYGPPGTGKSFLGKILISDVLHGDLKNEATFFVVTARHLFGVENIKRLYRAARLLAPSIVFVEDVDLIGVSDRDENNGDLLNEFLNQLDGLENLQNVLTVATTNKENSLDPALVRSGRLGTHLYFGFPTLEEREQFFLKIIRKTSKLDVDVTMNYLLSASEGMTGADIVELISIVKQQALFESSWDGAILVLSKKHFAAGFKLVRPY